MDFWDFILSDFWFGMISGVISYMQCWKKNDNLEFWHTSAMMNEKMEKRRVWFLYVKKAVVKANEITKIWIQSKLHSTISLNLSNLHWYLLIFKGCGNMPFNFLFLTYCSLNLKILTICYKLITSVKFFDRKLHEHSTWLNI